MTVEDLSVPAHWRRRLTYYRLVAGRCKKCGRLHYPPAPACPYCGSKDLELIEINNKGKLETYTIIYSAPGKSRGRAPIIVGVVNIEGLRIVSELTDIEPEELKTGIDVEPVLRRMDEDTNKGIIRYAIKFRPVLVPKSEERG